MAGISNIINILRGDGLKAKSARGVLKLGIGTFVERALRLVRTMILTRILIPDEFGLMAIILAFVNIFEAFAEVGVRQSAIQNKRGADPEYLNVVWWFQAFRSLILFFIAVLAAPFINSFYDKPGLLRLLQFTFLVILFRGFISPRAHILEKEYKFGRKVLLTQGSALLGTIVTIYVAFYTRNIWALVIGYVSEQCILCLLSYVVVPFVPKPRYDKECLSELLIFAKGMFGLPILMIIGFGAPVFVLGKIVNDERLGMYSLAVQLVGLPIYLFTKVISPVLLPVFSEKQDDRRSMNEVVLKITRFLAVIVIPLVSFMACCASGLLFILWGPQFVPVTIPCAILCLLVLVRTQSFVLSTTYLAVGQPSLQRRFVLLWTGIILILIYPASVYFELLGAAVVVILANCTALFMQVLWCRRIIPLKFESYFRCYFPGLLLSFPVIIAIRLLLLFGVDSLYFILIFGTLALLVTYIIYFGNIFLIYNRGFYSQLKNTLRSKNNRIASLEVQDV